MNDASNRGGIYVGGFALALMTAATLGACFAPDDESNDGSDGNSENSDGADERLGEVQQELAPDASNARDKCTLGQTDDRKSFAVKCDIAIGASVPPFSCETGTLVDEGNEVGTYPIATCDRPNVLRHECDPGSRFQMLTPSPANADVFIAAHCRKQGNVFGKYGDIAVIQYNRKNGNTCFYQALGDLDGINVPAPNTGDAFWMPPNETAEINCVSCHDNGPFIRTPYLAHLGLLPGTGGMNTDFNKSRPYKFVGADFQSWKAFTVKDPDTDNPCANCHRMGFSALNGAFNLDDGTSLSFGNIATAQTQAQRHTYMPPWMVPGTTAYTAANEANATKYKNLANSAISGNSSVWSQYAKGNTCQSAANTLTVGNTTTETPSTGRVLDSVPSGICADGNNCKGRPGFLGIKQIKGPLWQTSASTVPFTDPGFRGAYVRIFINSDGLFEAERFKDSGATSIAPPSIVAEGVGFSEILPITNPDGCTHPFATVIDPTGASASTTTVMGLPNTFMAQLTGLIGNVAQAQGDLVRVMQTGSQSISIRQQHSQSTMPFPSGYLKGESYRSVCSGWVPQYWVQDLEVTNDAQLVSAANAGKARCFITGITGAWSSTAGSAQPYAHIYDDVSGAIRMKVFPETPAGLPPPVGRVTARASCVKTQ